MAAKVPHAEDIQEVDSVGLGANNMTANCSIGMIEVGPVFQGGTR